jgi:ATP-dependent exoDNAse (exonuclease V) alpha subunit
VAIYHLSIKPLSRSAGRSATAAAAYRSGTSIHDRTSDEVFDYTRKRGVEHSEIVLPAGAAKADINWARERQALWNAAEEAERRKDARIAREYEVALPHELNKDQRLELVREFATEIADRHGVAVDFAIHAPHRKGDERNHHAHILATTRQVTATGLGAKSAMEWSDQDRKRGGLVKSKDEVTAIRERWAQLTNTILAERGHASRVDHRSLEAQGINDREPTTHKGVAIVGLERRGIEPEVSRRVDWQAQELAQRRIELAAEAGRLEREQVLIESRLLVLSTDIVAARHARDDSPALSPHRPTPQAWLQYRRDTEDRAARKEGADDQQLRQRGVIQLDEHARFLDRSDHVPEHDP